MLATDNRLILSEVCQGIFVLTIILFSFREGLTVITQAAGLLLILAFAYEVMFRAKSFKFTLPLPLLCFLGFVIYSMLSLIWTNQSVDFAATLLQLFLISFVMINIIRYQGQIRSITFGILSALLIASADMWMNMDGAMAEDDSVRISSFLGNANVFAIALFIGVLLVVDALFSHRQRTRSAGIQLFLNLALSAIGILFIYEVIFLTGSRKAMIALFIFSFMFFFRYLLKVKFLMKIVIVALGAGAFSVLLMVTKESIFYQRFLKVFDMLLGKSVREGSINERASMIADGIGLWKQHPVFGWGTDQFRYVSGYQTYSHNNYVELLSNNGLVGLVLYYSMFVFLLAAGIGLIRSGDKSANHYGWLNVTTLAILIFWDFALVSYYSKLQWVVLSVIMGLTYYVYSNLKRKDQEKPSNSSREGIVYG